MGALKFDGKACHFDGECVRFKAFDGDTEILCGVTTYALKHHEPGLPLGGLLPSDAFIKAYEDFIDLIHDRAQAKYQAGEYEPAGEVRIMVHDRDW